MKLVKVGDMFHGQAADSDLRVKGECGDAVTATLKYLLERSSTQPSRCAVRLTSTTAFLRSSQIRRRSRNFLALFTARR